MVDYNYYLSTTISGNKIPQNEFNKYEIRAELYLKNRLIDITNTTYQTEIKNCICSICDIVYNQNLIRERINKTALGEDMIVSSEKVGDYSRTSGIDAKSLTSSQYTDELINNEIDLHLYHTGLVYGRIDVY